MKKLFLKVLLIFIVIAAVVFEQSDKAWPLERDVISILARLTHRPLPSMTAVKMPLVQSHLSPEDVALAFRAIVSFHPQQIFVIEPVGDFFTGPFSLIREAVEQGELQGVPIRFLTSEKEMPQKKRMFPNVHLISLEDLLLHREERERGSIRPELDALFTGQTVLLGGPEVAEQAGDFINQDEKQFYMPAGLEMIFLLLLLFVLGKFSQLPWVDFLLLIVGTFFCFMTIDAWAFHAYGKISSLLAPCTVLVLGICNKVLSCTSKAKG